jgi:hypothetical protein
MSSVPWLSRAQHDLSIRVCACPEDCLGARMRVSRVTEVTVLLARTPLLGPSRIGTTLMTSLAFANPSLRRVTCRLFDFWTRWNTRAVFTSEREGSTYPLLFRRLAVPSISGQSGTRSQFSSLRNSTQRCFLYTAATVLDPTFFSGL